MVEAHALCIHLNYLQEAVQPEGDTVAKGGLSAIRRVAKALKVPLVAKETGAGISVKAATALVDVGVKAIDVGGLGGTSFSAVEHWRALEQKDPLKARLGRTFWDWGLPTPATVREVRVAHPGLPLVATGGLRSGLDALRALACGANVAGFAGHLFRAAAEGPRGATSELGNIKEELKTGLFLLGLPAPHLATQELLA